MPRVQTNLEHVPAPIAAPPPAFAVANAERKLLRPGQITIGAQHPQSRPGPVPVNEEAKLREMALSMQELGNVEPILVEAVNGNYELILGGRRLKAASILDTDEHPFYLKCDVVPVGSVDRQYIRKVAIHENLKRRNYNALQFAHLCHDLQQENGWTGTQELANYLGVSRAQVSQHLKLLSKPEGMDDATYEKLLATVGSGLIGADTAFFALTKVKPELAGQVIERAQEIAKEEAAAEPEPAAEAAEPVAEPVSEPASAGKTAGKAKNKAATKSKPPVRVQEPDWMKRQRAESKKRKEEKQARAAAGGVTTNQLKKAAEEKGATVTSGAKTEKQIDELFDDLSYNPVPILGRLASSIKCWRRGTIETAQLLTVWGDLEKIIRKYNSLIHAPRKKSAKKK